MLSTILFTAYTTVNRTGEISSLVELSVPVVLGSVRRKHRHKAFSKKGLHRAGSQ